MNKELDYAITKLETAFAKLKEGSHTAKDELEKDGVIQRFEFTFELLWKTVKIFLRHNGIETKTPRESMQEAFKIGWVQNEACFLNMLEDRNKTSHLYDKETAEEILKRIREDYIPAIEVVVQKLKG